MVQPGPLWLSPADRSFRHPSYRIIDYGRARTWDDALAGAEADLKRSGKKTRAEMDDKEKDEFLASQGRIVSSRYMMAEMMIRSELGIVDFDY